MTATLAPHEPVRQRPGLTSSRNTARQMTSFAVIGVVCTTAYVGLYAAFRNVLPAAAANALALVVTAVCNTAANRRLTFEVRGRDGLARHHVAGLVALAVALTLTSASLALLDVVAPHRGRLTEIVVLVAANAAATLVRFLLLRFAIDRVQEDRRRAEAGPSFATLSTSKRTRG